MGSQIFDRKIGFLIPLYQFYYTRDRSGLIQIHKIVYDLEKINSSDENKILRPD